MKVLSAFLLLVLSQVGYASDFETVIVPGSNFYIGQSETQTLQFDSWRYVKKIYVQARGTSTYGGQFEVIVNGDVKGTIYVPGRDPSYVVTIGESLRSIQFRYRSGGGAYISKVQAVQHSHYRSDPDRFEMSIDEMSLGHFPRCFEAGLDCDYDRSQNIPATNQAAYLAKKAIILSERLQDFARHDEYGTYLLPIKLVAARTYAVARARGNLSKETRIQLIALKRQIECAYNYLEGTFERDAAFNVAVDLMALGRSLEDLLD